jgi:hypothetical protein
MKLILLLITSVLSQNPLPGVCSNSQFGIGCSIDRTNQSLNGMNFKYSMPVIQMNYCNNCSNNCPDYCYAIYNQTTYSIPSNVFFLPYDELNTCYYVSESKTIESYEQETVESFSGGGFFDSWSTTIIRGFIRTYEEDTGLFVMNEKNILWELSLAYFLNNTSWFSPTQQFLDDAEYYLRGEYNYDTMIQMVNNYGTDILVSAGFGGSTELRSFYHSCFQQTQTWTDISNSGSEFFFHKWGNQNNGGSLTQEFIDWSKWEMQVLGGDASKVNMSDTNFASSSDIQSWLQSLTLYPEPVFVKTIPIYSILNDSELQSNLNRTINDYFNVSHINFTNFISDLSTKDPECVPTWCNLNGKNGDCTQLPPASSIPSSTPSWYNNNGYYNSTMTLSKLNTNEKNNISNINLQPCQFGLSQDYILHMIQTRN